jgi:putative transposase
MPRKARIDAPGALHHIIVRGIERRRIFYDDIDRTNFVDRLEAVLTESETPCFAWSLLPNHLHLLLRTGTTPLATVMRRLLTGYAVSFNLRHRRHGQLFQNRYKSILCQEDPYLLELVRYIHLNPLRAEIVGDLKALEGYAYCGHGVLLGRNDNRWQDVVYVLRRFGKNVSAARWRYREFVERGVEEGKRPELVGGGLIRSAGGWSAVKAMRRSGERIKGDERILGDGDFVGTVLQVSREKLKRQSQYQAEGYDFDWLIERVAQTFGMNAQDVLRRGRYPSTVRARSLLCFWAVRELGISTIELSGRLRVSQPSVSQSVRRGEKIAAEHGYVLLDTPEG